MPTLHVVSLAQAPQPSRVSKAVREQQMVYENYINMIGMDVGDLELTGEDDMRSLKVRLRRASSRMGLKIDMWDLNNHLYFTVKQNPVVRRGRPRKSP